jgi:hypothetical protein
VGFCLFAVVAARPADLRHHQFILSKIFPASLSLFLLIGSISFSVFFA